MADRLCELGLTETELRDRLGARLDEFWTWMRGQTTAVCDGKRFDHDTREYYPTNCGPHGSVVYSHDFNRFLAGWPVND